jgi:enterochelin esterase family protein
VTDEINRQLVSPEVHADGRVTFRLRAPRAARVLLKGIANRPPQPLNRQPSGIWETTIDPLPAERYSYLFEVDEADQLDLHNRDVKKWLSSESQFVVPGNPPLLHERAPVPHGVLQRHVYSGAANALERTAWIYTPPGYTPDAEEPYPVLYLFHGYGDDETAWIEVGCCPWIVDNLIAQRLVRPLVVVMPNGHPLKLDLSRKFDDYSSDNVLAMREDVTRYLDPYIRQQFAIASEASQRAIAGLSMGGGQSLTIGLQHRNLFAHVGGFSSAAPQEPLAQSFPDLIADVPAANQSLKTLWIACGEEDFLLRRNDEFVGKLNEAGIDATYELTKGGHDWTVWRRYLAQFLQLCFAS